MKNFVKDLEKDIPKYSITTRTAIHPNTGHAFKQIFINKQPTNCGWDIEEQLIMVSLFGNTYNYILYEKVKSQILEFISINIERNNG